MILYLADRQFNVLETASTGLRRGTKVLEDTLTRRVADGDSFECVFDLADKTLAEAEGIIFPTSNIIMLDGDAVSVFAILETEYDSESREMRVYAESEASTCLIPSWASTPVLPFPWPPASMRPSPARAGK